MTLDSFRAHCLSFDGVTESFPFGGDTLVFKVYGKMFALCDADLFESINLKWPPEVNIERREEYPETVIPGYHMSKVHWSTVQMDGAVQDRVLKEWIRESYDIVLASIPVKKRVL